MFSINFEWHHNGENERILENPKGFGGPGREVTPTSGHLPGNLPRGGRAVRPTVLEDRMLEDSE